MIIGMTYDLRSEYMARGMSLEQVAEFDSDETIQAIEGELTAQGHVVDRIGSVHRLVERLAAGDRWDLVFNIAEGLHGLGREALVPALLDAYRIPYVFSDPLVLALTLDKAMAKRVVRDLGIPTPDFAVVREPSDIGAVRLGYPLFAKPVAEGTGKGVSAASRITNAAELDAVCRELLVRHHQPVLVEEFLPGREFTIGIVGNGAEAKALAVLEVHLLERADAAVYTQRNKEECESLVEYHLAHDAQAEEARDVALAAWRGLGCRDGGRVDVRLDARGRASFIEVNPLAGLHPTHSDLPILSGLAGVSYRELLADIMAAALSRLGWEHPPAGTGDRESAKARVSGECRP